MGAAVVYREEALFGYLLTMNYWSKSLTNLVLNLRHSIIICLLLLLLSTASCYTKGIWHAMFIEGRVTKTAVSGVEFFIFMYLLLRVGELVLYTKKPLSLNELYYFNYLPWNKTLWLWGSPRDTVFYFMLNSQSNTRVGVTLWRLSLLYRISKFRFLY